MTLKLENTSTELRKGWNLAWYHHLTHKTCVHKLRGLRQNWMHFMYKLDHLFQSTRDWDENSSVSKGFHFSTLISTQDFFCIQYAHYKATYHNFNPFWLHLLFFMHSMIYFELNDLEIGKHYNWNQKRLKLGMVSSFDPHNMCAKVERLRQKLDALHVQTGPSPSEYQVFRRKLICYEDISYPSTDEHITHNIVYWNQTNVWNPDKLFEQYYFSYQSCDNFFVKMLKVSLT